MRNLIKTLLFLLMPTLAMAQQHYTDSLKNILKTAKADSTRYSALNGIGEFYVEINRDSAIHYFDNALYIAKKNNRDLNEAATLARKGYVLVYQGKYPESLVCFREALDLGSDPHPVGTIWNPNMPWLKFSTPDKSRLTILAGIHLLYGVLMRATGDTTEDMIQLKLSRKYAIAAGDINFTGVANMNLGYVFYMENSIDSALILEKNAERISMQTGYKKYLAFIYLVLGNIYLKKGNANLALQYYHHGLNTSLEQKTFSLANIVYTALAGYYIAKREKDSSLYYAINRLKLVRQLNSNDLDQAYEDMCRSYQLANNTDSAYKYQGLALAAKDIKYKATVQNLTDFKNLSMKQQLSLQALQKEKEDTQARLRMYALLAIIVVVLIVAFFIYRNSRQRKKANHLLLEQKEEISAQRDSLEDINRELGIESALERVRSVAMGMQQPDDMLNICREIAQQLELLGIREIRNVQTAIIYEARGTYINYEYYRLYERSIITEVDYSHPIQANFIKKMLIEGTYQSLTLEGDELHNWYEYQKTTNQFPDPHLAEAGVLNYNWFSIGPVALGISMYEKISEEGLELFKRFLDVFRLAYRRYLDIEKAIAQAKEAQVELALERVRARTMAMQHSNELAETAYLLFQQFKELGENPDQATIGIINEAEWVIEYWVTLYGNQTSKVFKFSIDELHVTHKIYKAWKANKKSLVIELSGKELQEFSKYRAAMGGAGYNKAEKLRVINVAFFSKGIINVQSTFARSPESISLLERFAGVFEQTYTRFLDLQKAEAQAREANIGAALEKVRSHSLAMHKSDELNEVVAVVAGKLQELGIEMEGAVICIPAKDKKSMMMWSAMNAHMNAPPLYIPYGHPLIAELGNIWESGVEYFAKSWSFEEKDNFWKWAFQNSDFKYLPDFRKDQIMAGTGYALSTAFSKNSGITIPSHTGQVLSDENAGILKRFAKVFEQAYTRFLDLQKAEAQAREAQIEAALERTRTQSMVMQHSSELDDTLRVFHEQVLHLGINSAFSFLWLPSEKKDRHIFWAAWADNDQNDFKSKAVDYELDRNEPATAQCLIDWKGNDPVVSYHVPPEGVENYFAAWHELIDGVAQLKPEFFKGGLYYVEAFMKYGCFGVMAEMALPAEEQIILGRFAIEFERAYTRFLDLQKAEAHAIQAAQDLILLQTEKKRTEDALTELQATQKQLIQTEKMASLGELTAGIAHEIQNPLNFVNNFSEVNREMLEELKAESAKPKADRDDQLETELINDLIENEQKINHHGKRADSIVKGMLQHSRASTGEKQETNINTLADEFLKLSYHGLRAKDKSFNAELTMHFDDHLPKVNIAQQDIGRVLLNLFNNAFYAVNQKQKTAGADYKPEVTVATSEENGSIIIKVKDNGNGIPDNIKDKIMQPFFTTKPTGEGTGLGLSISYDIVVKGHGGRMAVNSTEGEGSEFIITLSLN